MTSFFDKLTEKMNGKGRSAVGLRGGKKEPAGVAPDPAKPKTESLEEELESQKLDIDLFQGPVEIVIYALAAGVDPDDFDIILDEENDLLIIKGNRKRPPKLTAKGEKDTEGKFVTEECVWTTFMRKVVLPAEVDVVKAEAIFKKGILIITLPILKVTEGRHLKVVETLSDKPKASAEAKK